MPSTSCRFCSSRNPAAAKFCNECGSPLDLKPCPHCDAINHLAVDTCHQCGAALPNDSSLDVAPVHQDAAQASSANSSDSVADTPTSLATAPEGTTTSETTAASETTAMEQGTPASEAPSETSARTPLRGISLDSIPIALSKRFDEARLRSPEPSAVRSRRRREPTLEAGPALASALATSMPTTVPERLQASVPTPAMASGSNADAGPVQTATPAHGHFPAPARSQLIGHTKVEQISPATLAASADDRSIARWRTLGVIPDTPAEARRRRSVSYAVAAIGVALCIAGVGAYYAVQGATVSDAIDAARAIPAKVQRLVAGITTFASMRDFPVAHDAMPSTSDTSQNATASGGTPTPPAAAEASQPSASSDPEATTSSAQPTPAAANRAPQSAAPSQAEDGHVSAQRAATPPGSSARAKHRAATRAATRPSPPLPGADRDAAATQRLIERDLAGFLPPLRSAERPSQ